MSPTQLSRLRIAVPAPLPSTGSNVSPVPPARGQNYFVACVQAEVQPLFAAAVSGPQRLQPQLPVANIAVSVRLPGYPRLLHHQLWRPIVQRHEWGAFSQQQHGWLSTLEAFDGVGLCALRQSTRWGMTLMLFVHSCTFNNLRPSTRFCSFTSRTIRRRSLSFAADGSSRIGFGTSCP